MTSYGEGWFKVSHRIFDSSRWHGGSSEAVKVLFFLIGKAQALGNPRPGVVQMSDIAIANCCGLDRDAATVALEWLCSRDPQSRTRTNDGCTVRRLEDGSGFELLNYEPYHPGEKEAAEARAEKARNAAKARWSKTRGGSEGAATGVSPGARFESSAVDQRSSDGPTEAASCGGAAAARSLPQIQKGQSPNTSGSLRPEPGPAGDPEQGQAVGGSGRVLVTGPDAHQPSRVHVTREATGERVPVEDSFKPTVQYPTEADRRAANSEAGELCVWLEARCGRSSGEVFRAAADYPNAPSFKARADMCTAPRLEQTLLTLREWKRRCELSVCDTEASWALKPRPGEAQPPKRDFLSQAADEIRARLEAERGDGPEAGRASGWQAPAGRAALPGGE